MGLCARVRISGRLQAACCLRLWWLRPPRRSCSRPASRAMAAGCGLAGLACLAAGPLSGKTAENKSVVDAFVNGLNRRSDESRPLACEEKLLIRSNKAWQGDTLRRPRDCRQPGTTSAGARNSSGQSEGKTLCSVSNYAPCQPLRSRGRLDEFEAAIEYKRPHPSCICRCKPAMLPQCVSSDN